MLIRTKLYLPALRATILDRRRLVDKLSARKDRRLVMIVGQAGSGKTSLVSQWIRQDGLQCAWYSLDENDNEPQLFFRYFLTALAATDNKIEHETRLLLRGQTRLSKTNILPVIIDSAENLPVDTYLVLDDYHVIKSKEIHDAISALLDYLPPKMHFVLISRHEVPFSLSRLKSRDQMAEISPVELKLTEKERSLFFSEITPLKLPPHQLRALAAYTEGWIGGLQLIGLSLQGKEDLSSFAEALNNIRHTTSDYLISEVINTQPEKVRTFVCATVHLNRFSIDLCREITGIKEVPEILDYLHRINLFLTPLDAEHKWYCYHHMFSEALRADAGITPPDIRSKILRKAAIWFAHNGYLEDAFQHAFASGDIEFVADIMEGYVLDLLERYEVKSALRWFSMIPRDVLTNHPLLRLHECWAKIPSLDWVGFEAVMKDVEDNLEQALTRYNGTKRRRFLDYFIFLKHMLAYCRDPAVVDVASVKEGLKQISSKERHGLQMWMAECLRYQGKASMARAVLNEVSRTELYTKNLSWSAMWFRVMANVRKYQGDLSGAESVLNEGFVFLGRKQLQDTALEYHFYLPMASIFYARNELEKAKRYAVATLRSAHHTNKVSDIADGNFLLAMIQMAKGKSRKVNACIRGIESVSRAGQVPTSFIALSNAYTALLCLMQGRLEFAEQWARERRLSMDEPFSVRFLFESLLQSRIYICREMYAEAEQMLKKLRDTCVKGTMMEAVLDIDVLHSATLYALGRHEEARTLMIGAFAFAETKGYVRPFVDCWPFISNILLDIARCSSHHSPGHLRVILEASGISPETNIMKKQALVQNNANLTVREKEVLRLIVSGYTTNEIATKHFISRNTVKTHIAHIFDKLGVKTRVQAVLEAKRLNLFGEVKPQKITPPNHTAV